MFVFPFSIVPSKFTNSMDRASIITGLVIVLAAANLN
jgi:hypothetical protein